MARLEYITSAEQIENLSPNPTELLAILSRTNELLDELDGVRPQPIKRRVFDFLGWDIEKQTCWNILITSF